MSDLKDLIWRIQEKMPVDHAELLDLVNHIEAQAAEIKRLREAIKRQAAAVRTLHHNEQTEINVLRRKSADAHRAVATLDSELEMNAVLTEELEAQAAEIERLREALREMFEAVCGETGFAQAVRAESGFAYPWPALDIAEAMARAALGETK